MLQAASPAVNTKPTASHLEVPRRLFCHDQDLQDVLVAEGAKAVLLRAPAEASIQSDSEGSEPEQASKEEQDDSAGSDTLDASLAGTLAVHLLPQCSAPQCQ